MDETARKKLLEEYASTRSSELREKIILEYAPLVKAMGGAIIDISATSKSINKQ